MASYHRVCCRCFPCKLEEFGGCWPTAWVVLPAGIITCPYAQFSGLGEGQQLIVPYAPTRPTPPNRTWICAWELEVGTLTTRCVGDQAAGTPFTYPVDWPVVLRISFSFAPPNGPRRLIVDIRPRPIGGNYPLFTGSAGVLSCFPSDPGGFVVQNDLQDPTQCCWCPNPWPFPPHCTSWQQGYGGNVILWPLQ